MSYKPVSELTEAQQEEYRTKRRVYQQHYRKKQPEKSKKISQEGYQRNKEKRLKARKQRHSDEPWHQMVITARRSSTRTNVPFDIDAEYVKSIFPTDNKCPVFETLFTTSTKGKTRDQSPSLDKIIPSLGYVKGNVVIISLKANRMKNNGSIEELQRLVNFYLRKARTT